MSVVCSCVDCSVRACCGNGASPPDFCLSKNVTSADVESALDILINKDSALATAAAQTDCDGYCDRSRIEEVMHLAKLMGIRKLGIATCVGLFQEARQLARVFRAHGYEVYGVACKCGSVPLTAIGITPGENAKGPYMCNPVLQANLLNQQGTQLNVAFGLCVGHDSLFYKYSDAYVTTLVAKDRLLCHNPIAPLYLLDGYWKKLLAEDPYVDF